MFITREVDYAIRCTLYLAKNYNQLSSVKEIARAMFVPKSFLAKILQKLTKARIVDSVMGTIGGFKLSRKPKDITLFEVISSIQYPFSKICIIEGKKCRFIKVCSVHPVWLRIKDIVENQLKKENLEELSDSKMLEIYSKKR